MLILVKHAYVDDVYYFVQITNSIETLFHAVRILQHILLKHSNNIKMKCGSLDE